MSVSRETISHAVCTLSFVHQHHKRTVSIPIAANTEIDCFERVLIAES
jgi:hypothetical protein